LPSRAGTLRVEVPAIVWWDVAADRARETVVSPLEVDVAAAVGVYRAPRAGGVAPADAGSWVRVPGVQGPIHRWALATVVFALLWLVTLGWALQWRQRALAGRGPGDGAAASAADAGHPARGGRGAVRRALDVGDPGDVSALVSPPASAPAGVLPAPSDLL